MEIPVIFEDRSHAQENLIIKKKIAEGKFNIYHAFSTSRNSDFALKVFPKNSSGTAHYKREQSMARLNHPNIIKYVPITSCQTKFHALLSELATYGSFLDLVTNDILDTEILARTYFHQLIEGMEYLHSQGVAHLDLKLENLMLGADFQLKIIDFDQAQPLKDNQMKSGGTSNYRAPEVLTGACRDLAAADVYAAGVILYALIAKEFPLTESSDEKVPVLNNSTFINNNNEFWEAKAERIGISNYFTEDFIHIINGMLDSDAEKRFKIKDIKSSKWYQDSVLKDRCLRNEMRIKCEKIFKNY